MRPIPESRRGIALIIVLAFLTILILMAVTFTAMMRTERVASRNYTDTVRARHFAQTGLARAMQDIEDELAGAQPSYPNWVNRSLFSQGALGQNEEIHRLAEGEVRSYFPYSNSVWNAVRSQITGGAARWEAIEDPEDSDVTLGRVSFWVFDCSGLLDVSAIHSQDVVRAEGVEPGEIRLHPTMSSIANLTQIHTNRARFLRYASIAELARLGPTNNFLTARNPPTNPDQAQNLINFSHFPAGYWNENGGGVDDRIFIGTEAAVAARRSDIESRLGEAPYNLNAAQREQFVANLLDYLDDNKIPGSSLMSGVPLNSISTEAVPMLNEVGITNRVAQQISGTNIVYINVIDVGVEVWYPFPSNPDPSEYRVRFTLSGPGEFMPDEFDANERVIPGGAWPGGNNGIRTVPRFRARRQITRPDDEAPPDFPSLVQFQLTVLNAAGVPVDDLRIRYDWQDVFVDSFSPPGEIAEEIVSKEAVDPRINWSWDNHWQDGSSMGSINPSAEAVYTQADKDGTWQMYVADGPMTNTGEMGFLLYDATKPWETVPLLGSDAWPVWNQFTAIEEPLTRGLVHLKTRERDVLAALFHQAPHNIVPGVADGTFSWANAQTLADRVMTLMEDADLVNVGDIGGLDLSGLGLATPLEQKSVLRHSADLFSTRQQVFTIIVDAEALATTPEVNPANPEPFEILARQKALAVIWRDPFGVEPTVTQYFEWLTD